VSEQRLSEEEQRALAVKFASGNCTVREAMLGPAHDFKKVYRPRVASRYVHNSDDPEDGFATRAEALAAARRFKENCRGWLERHRQSFGGNGP